MRLPALNGSTRPGVSQPPGFSGHHARHVLSRRAFLSGTAGVSAAAVGAGLLGPTAAFAASSSKSNPDPNPTTQTVNFGGPDFHINSFGPGIDPSSITDFNGFVGVAEVQGSGTGTNEDGSTVPLIFDTDMRFMSGVYVAKDGRVHKGTFGFV
jgi:hypothetical protein